MPQDLLHMDLLGSYRSRLSELHEEFPPNGFCIPPGELEEF